MFRLPSIQTLSDQFVATVSRFKWVVLAALVKTVLFIWLSETTFKQEAQRDWIVRILYVVNLSLPLALAISLLSERRRWKPAAEFAAMGMLVAVMAGYYFSMDDKASQIDFYRFTLFMLAAHLLVSFAAFTGFHEPNGFWQFNKTLFLQILNATLYAVTLYLGLLIAVETVRLLFNIHYEFKIEADLAAVIFALFHTIFFLSKIPPNLGALEQQTDYPAGLKIFTQYVLLPLEVVYLLILYAYTGKIIVQWQLPEGGVTYLVLAFSIAGILALLLLFPLRENQTERWVRLFSKRFYLALVPLIILFFTGISRRIYDYGVTENRYLVAVLACWLAGITAYFLLSKKDDIRWIPVTLAVICVVLPVGPWNIFKVARESQLRQFDELVIRHHLLDTKGKIASSKTIPQEDYDRLFSIVQFFRNREEIGLEKYFPGLKPLSKNRWEHYSGMEEYLSQHIKNSQTQVNNNDSFNSFSFRLATPEEQTVDVASFEHLMFFSVNNLREMNTDSSIWKVVREENSKMLDVYHQQRKVVSFDLEKKMKELAAYQGKTSEEVPANKLIFDFSDDKNRIRIVLNSLSRSGNMYYAEGFLLY
ncbi:DUF4153 domain-containing protein [Dyadobacter sandarakinus]|uniref:DUF4153 domain-containing protein n=1 Tax=Dyadobacter sandarakinus TaxID=2747268 RepID=A0ABX7IA04_9BACT|nr:DUF4153 domain-containing protein [Dyadobacter sandarakinus]QRR02648.1 DUF4153 domain-containing protein [Dyadobacter sandarakinus]